MNLDLLIRDVQTSLGLTVDGHAGPQTWTAIHAKLVGKKAATLAPPAVAQVDARSEGNIATLLNEVQPYARALVHAAAAQGITIRIISGLRTYEEQAGLYAQGRTVGTHKVTNANAGYSNHNFGLAFDVGIFQGSRYLDESPLYKVVGALGRDLGLEWGGNWKSFTDEPHFQLRPDWAAAMSERDMLTELRARKASGKRVFEA